MKLNLNNRTCQLALVLAVGLASLPALSMRPQESKDAGSAPHVNTQQTPSSTENAGAIKFKQNCSRCHEAPQGFSSRISGTIVRHMRVRASLSAQDERDILRFLNP